MRFAANVSLMFHEHPFLERFRAAAAAGLELVEFHYPYEYDRDTLVAAVRGAGVRVVLINTHPGDVRSGEWGTLSLPGRRDHFRRMFQETLAWTEALGAMRVHTMVGRRDPSIPEADQWECVQENLLWAAPRAADAGVTLVIEALNQEDVPGALLHRSKEGLDVVKAIDHPSVRFLFDVYHLQKVEGNLIQTFQAEVAWIGHVQIADVPERGEPGTGEINFPNVLAAFKKAGYDGPVGLEYRPTTSTVSSLAWLQQLGPATSR